MPNASEENLSQPSTPGGDPNQADSTLPHPPALNEREVENKDKTGYGHIGNREEVPRSKNVPKPHQIF